jgi:hypothetical protein
MKERVVRSSELKDALVAFGVNHPMDPDGVRDRHVLHILRSDKDVLFATRRLGSIDLGKKRHARS